MIGDSDNRPWGSWQVVDAGDGFQVKHLDVLPHSRLSYQTHQHRAEHWVVVTGKATCILDGTTYLLGPGDTLDIGVGQAHRICNDTDEPLAIVEVQRGDYLGEDDIVRLEDDFGRA